MHYVESGLYPKLAQFAPPVPYKLSNRKKCFKEMKLTFADIAIDMKDPLGSTVKEKVKK